MTETFQVGDVVRLKSGSPKMTVTQVGEDALTGSHSVWCAWFVSTKQETGTFPVGAVEPATTEMPARRTVARGQF